MMASSRSLQPLLQIPILLRGSRSRPGHAFQIQRYLLQGPKREEKGFPCLVYKQDLSRKKLLGRLKFPRKYEPIPIKISWTVSRIPRFLTELVSHGVRYPFWWRTTKKGVVVKSRVGSFFNDFLVDNPKVWRLLNTTVQPWGFFHYSTGRSMEPTLGGNPGILYSSYAYIDRDDLKVGDVVMVLDIDFDAKRGGGIIKRIAGLEGNRLWVTTGRYRTPYVLPVRFGRIS